MAISDFRTARGTVSGPSASRAALRSPPDRNSATEIAGDRRRSPEIAGKPTRAIAGLMAWSAGRVMLGTAGPGWPARSATVGAAAGAAPGAVTDSAAAPVCSAAARARAESPDGSQWAHPFITKPAVHANSAALKGRRLRADRRRRCALFAAGSDCAALVPIVW